MSEEKFWRIEPELWRLEIRGYESGGEAAFVYSDEDRALDHAKAFAGSKLSTAVIRYVPASELTADTWRDPVTDPPEDGQLVMFWCKHWPANVTPGIGRSTSSDGARRFFDETESDSDGGHRLHRVSEVQCWRPVYPPELAKEKP